MTSWKTALQNKKNKQDVQILGSLLNMDVELENGVFESEGYRFSVSDIQSNQCFTVTFEKILPSLDVVYDGIDPSFKDSIEVIPKIMHNEDYVNRLQLTILKKINDLEKLLRD